MRITTAGQKAAYIIVGYLMVVFLNVFVLSALPDPYMTVLSPSSACCPHTRHHEAAAPAWEQENVRFAALSAPPVRESRHKNIGGQKLLLFAGRHYSDNGQQSG